MEPTADLVAGDLRIAAEVGARRGAPAVRLEWHGKSNARRDRQAPGPLERALEARRRPSTAVLALQLETSELQSSTIASVIQLIRTATRGAPAS